MKLRKINNEFCILLADLMSLGYPLPPVGTKLYYFKPLYITSDWDIAVSSEWTRYNGHKEGWDSIETSPYCNDVGKKNLGFYDCYIPINPSTFQILEDKKFSDYLSKRKK